MKKSVILLAVVAFLTMNITFAQNCTDSDYSLGFSAYLGVKGVCTDSTGAYTDSSPSNTLVNEYSCGPTSSPPEQQACYLLNYNCLAYGYLGSSDGVCTNSTGGGGGSTTNQTCTDSDNGRYYNTKGNVTVCTYGSSSSGCSNIADSCSGNVLTEGYCSGNEAVHESYNCRYGCSDGRCLLPEDYCGNNVCDSETKTLKGGEVVYVTVMKGAYNVTFVGASSATQVVVKVGSDQKTVSKGSTTSVTSVGGLDVYLKDITFMSYTDQAKNSATLILGENEIHCSKDCKSTTNQTQACTDSDNGKNYYQYGSTKECTSSSSGNSGSGICYPEKNDFCSGDYLYEYYCSANNIATAETYRCENGCISAKCYYPGVMETTDKLIYNKFDTINLTLRSLGNSIKVDIFVYDDSGDNRQFIAKNVMVGNNFAITIKISDYWIFNRSGNYGIAVWDAGAFDATDGMCAGQCSNAVGIYVSMNTTATCIDSDGGLNYYVRGTISACNESSSGGTCTGTYDRCDGNTLIEGYCNGNEMAFERYACSNGCSNGACINKTSVISTCKTLGTVMYIANDGTGYIGCDIKVNGSFDLSKSYCQGQKTGNKKLLIPDSYGRPDQYYATLTSLDPKEEVRVFIALSQGEQIECPPALNKQAITTITIPITTQLCSDSDGGINYYTKGATSVCSNSSSGGTCTAIYDKCNGNTLTEYYCRYNEIKSLGYACPNGCNDGACLQANERISVYIKTDKYKYKLHEDVEITATAHEMEYRSSDLKNLILNAVIRSPAGKLDKINMNMQEITCSDAEKSIDSESSFVGCTATYTAAYGGAGTTGFYGVSGESSLPNVIVSGTSFEVFDPSLIEKYLILENIDGYEYIDAQTTMGPEGSTIYAASYREEKSGEGFIAGVAQFVSKEKLEKFVAETLQRYSVRKEIINGQMVYAFETSNEEVTFWTNKNFLVFVMKLSYTYTTTSQTTSSQVKIEKTIKESAISSIIKTASTAKTKTAGMAVKTTPSFVGIATTSSSGGGGGIGANLTNSTSGGGGKVCPVPNEIICKVGMRRVPVYGDDGCVKEYKCVYVSAELPVPLIKAYLDKYPSDLSAIGTQCESKKGYCISSDSDCKRGYAESSLSCNSNSEKCCVKEVSMGDIMEIVVKLDSLKNVFKQMQQEAGAMADYYDSIGDSANAKKYHEVSDMFGTAADKTSAILQKIKNNLDNPELIIDEVKKDIQELKDYIKEIIRKIIGE